MWVRHLAWAPAHESRGIESEIGAHGGPLAGAGVDYECHRSGLGGSHSVPGWQTIGGQLGSAGDPVWPCVMQY